MVHGRHGLVSPPTSRSKLPIQTPGLDSFSCKNFPPYHFGTTVHNFGGAVRYVLVFRYRHRHTHVQRLASELTDFVSNRLGDIYPNVFKQLHNIVNMEGFHHGEPVLGSSPFTTFAVTSDYNCRPHLDKDDYDLGFIIWLQRGTNVSVKFSSFLKDFVDVVGFRKYIYTQRSMGSGRYRWCRRRRRRRVVVLIPGIESQFCTETWRCALFSCK